VHAVSTGSIAQVPPLRTAAFVRSVTLARVLLDAGADPNSAVATARANGDDELLRLLRERGADG
jgi:ankyrin repeat protein